MTRQQEYMIAVFNVTSLSEAERGRLAMEVSVQAEATDPDEFHDGKPDIPPPTITWSEDTAGFVVPEDVSVPQVGDRVRLKHYVDRYPWFIADAGAEGVVVDIGDPAIFAVKMDEPIPGAETWENEIHWMVEDTEDPGLIGSVVHDLEVIR